MIDINTEFSPEGVFKKKLTNQIHNGLKVYEIIDGEITGLSIVENPANETKAKIISKENRTSGGVVLLPEKLIYRINPFSGEEFYIYFTKESIGKLYTKFRKKNWTKDEHLALTKMYSEFIPESEIAIKLNRDQEEIQIKIKEGGDSFRNMVIVMMAQNNKTINDISRRLCISNFELQKIVSDIGGELKENK